jgi:hypothetical protein
MFLRGRLSLAKLGCPFPYFLEALEGVVFCTVLDLALDLALDLPLDLPLNLALALAFRILDAL